MPEDASKRSLSFALAALLAFAAAAGAGAQAPVAGRYGPWGIELGARDLSIKPGDDFFRHASNRWFQANPIPADRTNWSVASMLNEEVEAQLRAILEESAGSSDAAARQVAEFYSSFMDETAIQSAGLAPARPYLDRIAAIDSRDDLIDAFAAQGIPSPVAIFIIPDPANPTRYIAGVGQGGLGLPNRDYYLREGAEYDRYRASYRDYVERILELAGAPDPAATADSIIALERRIAEVHWTPERSRDVRQALNPMDRRSLDRLAPQFDWPRLLGGLGLQDLPTIVVGQTTAISATGQLLETVPLETWKAWLTFQFLNAYAPYLPNAFEEANFNLHSRTLNGVERQRERWKRGIGLVNGFMGEGLGRLYVQRHFTAESRRQVAEIIDYLRAAFGDRLRRLDWMDQPTRREALAKLASFEARIGHPDRFIDYSALRIDRSDLLGNVIRAQEFQWNLQLSRLPNPVDRSLWVMNPQAINAYYAPFTNQITFPAAVLQPPFFNPRADPAVNFGSIGATIGHEMGHGFDDNGRRFDSAGRLRDWWTEAASTAFSERAARLGEQYSQYEPVPGVRVNGQLTMGENIGDLGGLEMAYAAYRRYVADHGEQPVLDGLTGDQRFFLAFAQSWRNNMREGALRQLVLTNPHSPPEFRVNGVVRNVDAWYRAFNVQPGDRLYLPPEQRVRIW